MRKFENYNIRWSVSGSIARVDIALSRDGGATWTTLATGINAGNGAFTLMPGKPKTTTGIVRMSNSDDASIFGVSGTFRIK